MLRRSTEYAHVSKRELMHMVQVDSLNPDTIEVITDIDFWLDRREAEGCEEHRSAMPCNYCAAYEVLTGFEPRPECLLRPERGGTDFARLWLGELQWIHAEHNCECSKVSKCRWRQFVELTKEQYL